MDKIQTWFFISWNFLRVLHKEKFISTYVVNNHEYRIIFVQNEKYQEGREVFLFHPRVVKALKSIKGYCRSMKRTHASTSSRREFTCVSALPWSRPSLDQLSTPSTDSYYALNHCLSFHSAYRARNPAHYMCFAIWIALMAFLTEKPIFFLV